VSTAGLDARIHYHPICLGDSEDVASKYRSLSSITRQFNHSTVALLKMDIEGFEHRVLDSLFKNALAGVPGALDTLPHQVSFELHYTTIMKALAWKEPARLSVAHLRLFWERLLQLGYMPVSREDNVHCEGCSEFTIVRVFC
jgi:hypothetical protein